MSQILHISRHIVHFFLISVKECSRYINKLQTTVKSAITHETYILSIPKPQESTMKLWKFLEEYLQKTIMPVYIYVKSLIYIHLMKINHGVFDKIYFRFLITVPYTLNEYTMLGLGGKGIYDLTPPLFLFFFYLVPHRLKPYTKTPRIFL